MASLYFRPGAMGAGKSLDLIKVYYNYKDKGAHAKVFLPLFADKSGKSEIVSRTGASVPCERIISETQLNEFALFGCNPRQVPNAVLVDEAQFLTSQQVVELAEVVDERNIPVICYGLRTDYRGELFEGAAALFALADKIEELKTICWCGQKATDNMLIVDGEAVYTGEQVIIDDGKLKGTYHAVCRKHWREGKWK